MTNILGVGWFLYDSEERKVCLHRRDSSAPGCPNTWDHFGGGFDSKYDQTELDTLKREVKEELNLDIEKDQAIEIDRGDSHVMYSIPFNMKRSGEILLKEGAGYAWLTVEGALSLVDLTPEARYRLSKVTG